MKRSPNGDPYTRLDYRRRIAWPARIAREWPFLGSELGRAPEKSVIDLGCGTGEHARDLASRGFRAVGIDRSSAQIETARDYEGEFEELGPRFVCGDLDELPTLVGDRFGAALCIGNVLPHLDEAELRAALAALAGRLHRGARLLIQLVNYESVLRRGKRHLPLNVRDDPENSGEIVFLRLLKADGERYVRFFPSTLLLRPGEDPPLQVKTAKEVRLRAWRLGELERILERQEFQVDGVYGDMEQGEFSAESSRDLVVTAEFAGGAKESADSSEGGER